MCGSTDQQKEIAQGQSDLFNQMKDQMSTIFGAGSSVFNDLTSALSPIVAAGPNQKGFSPAEEAALKSSAITQTGQAYKNARQAVGEHQAAQGGGTLALPGGSAEAADINLASQGAAQTAGELNQIEQANYTQGRENFYNAISPLESSTNVFNPATGAGEAATGAGSAAANTANQIAQQNNSWVSAVTGALGGVASNLVAPGNTLLRGSPGGGGGGFSTNMGSQTSS